MNRKAFTLIELLVVIAIIAILAAILFPVFTQAKIQGKGAASISNAHQISTAWVIYANDSDDLASPLATKTPGPLNFNGLTYSPWGQLLQPYLKSSVITQDPLTTPNVSENGIAVNLLWPYRPQFGYAFTVWSPLTDLFNASGDGKPVPSSLTAAAAPGDTVVFTSRKSRFTKDWTITGTIVWMAPAVAPPYCGGGPSYTQYTANTNVNPQSTCAISTRWGTDGSTGLIPEPTETEGQRTGAVAIRYFNKSVVVFSDSHVKAMDPSKIAAGTNWDRLKTSAQITMLDKTKYLWDLD
ncbi:MAG: prepilin-type N-terminal cleavage/methylation domain-containing protein [Armatimonadetes bacterium]|nr:prepilin-type N-terminal cleavage/methylation domain-containing protein [Armatimonadota bacterium]